MGQMKGKSAQQINDLKLKEVKNGRLAMIAIIGMITQSIIFDGKPTLSF
jgi:Chlorophyll A-B binding protein